MMQEKLAQTHTAYDLARRVNGRLVGSGEIEVNAVAGLDDAQKGTVSFLSNDKYRSKVLPSRASVVLVPPDFEESPPSGRAWIVCDDAADSFNSVIPLFTPPAREFPAGVHDTAVVDESVQLGERVHIGPYSVVEKNTVIGDDTVIGAHTYIGEETAVGSECMVHPLVTVRERTRIGCRVIIHSGATLGSDGFGFIPGEEAHKKIPQIGIVQVDDDVEIGAQAAIDRARFGRTWIKQGVKIDNLVHIAHNVIIGELSFVVAQVGISGSVNIGKGVSLAGQAGVSGHLDIGDGAIVMGQAGVTNDIPAGAKVVGMPAIPRRQFAKNQRNIEQVDQLKQRIKKLETQIDELKHQLNANVENRQNPDNTR